MFKINKITINHLTEPSGITGEIQVGWVLISDKKHVCQKAYELQIFSDKSFEKKIWGSGYVPSEESAHISVDYPWEEIKKYYVRVRSFSEEEETPWAVTSFVSGFQNIRNWQGDFISAESKEDASNSDGTYIRKTFVIDSDIEEAYLVSSAHGLYKAYINGRKAGDDEFSPGWTSYNKRLLYQTREITDMLKPGKNSIGVHLGAGWYKGEMSFNHDRNIYGKQTAFGGQIIVYHTDKSREVIASDATWKGTKSPVLFSEIYDGEIYDARAEIDGWIDSGFDDSAWKRTTVVKRDLNTLIPQQGCAVKEMTKVMPVALITTPKGERVIDFGQNLTGWCYITAKNADPGDRIELNFFEVLDSEGNVYTENLRSAKQTVVYICRGRKKEVYHPNFTFQGFRYAKITSYPGEVKLENFTAYAVHSDMEQTGYFSCSNDLLNRLQHNIFWGMKGNFLDVPTDCPQRDERLGWTGDAQIFCRTALFLMDSYAFYEKWLKDLEADQTVGGAVANVVPDILTGLSDEDWLNSQGTAGASAWADAAVIIPWQIYLVYGDKKILKRQYNSMKRWIDFMRNHSDGCLYSYKIQFGDWVALDAEEGSYFGATPTEYTSAAFYCYSTGLFAKAAAVLHRENDAAKYKKLYDQITESFKERYFTNDGRLKIETQTAHIVALYFGLVPEKYIKTVTKDLKSLLEKENGHLVTGFIGTPYFTHALSENGCLAEAYELLLKEDYPSWLYQVKMGATTVWEHWDGLKPDGTMWSPDMNSFNHYAYGSVGDWMYRVAGGLETDENLPGYKHFYIQPQIGGGLTWAEIGYESIYGKISIRWERLGSKVTLYASVPVNTHATIWLNQAKNITSADDLTFEKTETGFRAKADSGSYKINFII